MDTEEAIYELHERHVCAAYEKTLPRIGFQISSYTSCEINVEKNLEEEHGGMRFFRGGTVNRIRFSGNV